eukprot:gnl/Spiro4/9333_TR4915_c0_g1_i1.p1 gnl/Spiro4/9333_TR4915_c0_g1~~gnl/Spiro4/9333_TR4915_c0_g1_i1.p1  ORF type:complete len:307 (-),score=93.92 gnl/Spiro4/9333_TR4915_c0_g1_i1:83-973(-)
MRTLFGFLLLFLCCSLPLGSARSAADEDEGFRFVQLSDGSSVDLAAHLGRDLALPDGDVVQYRPARIPLPFEFFGKAQNTSYLWVEKIELEKGRERHEKVVHHVAMDMSARNRPLFFSLCHDDDGSRKVPGCVDILVTSGLSACIAVAFVYAPADQVTRKVALHHFPAGGFASWIRDGRKNKLTLPSILADVLDEPAPIDLADLFIVMAAGTDATNSRTMYYFMELRDDELLNMPLDNVAFAPTEGQGQDNGAFALWSGPEKGTMGYGRVRMMNSPSYKKHVRNKFLPEVGGKWEK